MLSVSSLRRVSFLFIFALLPGASAFGADDRAPRRLGPEDPGDSILLARRASPDTETPGALRLELDTSGLRNLARSKRTLVRDFPLPGKVAVDLDLTPFEILAPDARIVAVDEHGEHDRGRPAFKAFRGVVVGDPDSTVTLTMFDNRIAGSIRTWDDEFVITPREFNLARPDAEQVLVRRRADDPDQPGAAYCNTDEDSLPEPVAMGSETPGGEPETAESSGVDGGTLLKATIAIDATYEWYSHFGSLESAENYILNLMSQVSTIYENEVLVQLEVSYLRVFTTSADPYTDGTTDAGLLLGELRSEWNTNQTGIDRTAVHLFSRRPSGGSGIAYVDVLCNHDWQPGYSYDYGVSTLSANGGSWEKNLVAHELGHNFASPHTHCYVPEIDQCATESGCYAGGIVQTVSTIMSYCDQKTSTFHARVKDEKIRPAAEDAYPTCITTAGLPGRVGSGSGMTVELPNQCAPASLVTDDSSLNQNFGYNGTSQMAWVKRFTPSCYPFRIDQVDVLFSHSSTVWAGRQIRLLVYNDPSGSGDPANAILAHSEDTTVQLVSSSTFSQYALSSPVILTSGDYYVGVYDLVADANTTYIATVDSSGSGNSFRTANSTSPGSFGPHSGGTWMIRAHGGAVGSDGVLVSWTLPCNDATTPGQDYAVYRGNLGNYTSHTSVTCSTGRSTSYLAETVAPNSYVLVVPSTTANEGSYGTSSSGAERPASSAPCKPQSIGACP